MMKGLHTAAILLAMCSFVGACFGQSASKQPKTVSLCSMQEKVTEGNHETVRVSGVFSEGLEVGTLEDPACPKEDTWVEFQLKTKRNQKRLQNALATAQQAHVVFEGEFYGPPLPDPKLPEAIRKAYHPGWGHLAAFRTRLVVYEIRDVKALPANPDLR